jgi:lipid II:glycine glycyltransferase (peptidoglycan interpeptide bridge formation enzyme)
MIRQKKVFNFIKLLEIYYESEDKVLEAIKNISHLSWRIYSYFPLNLNASYTLLRTKETSRICLLDKTKESLLLSFKKNYRNEIRKTYQTSGCEIKVQEGFSKEGYSMYVDFEDNSKRPFLSTKNADGLWFLAYMDGQLMSGVYVIDVKPVLKIVAIFSSRKEVSQEKKKIIGYLSKRLIYEIGSYGISRKHEFVDLAYINREDPKKAGITAYKLGFGGDIINEYTYEKKTLLVKLLKLLNRR